MKSRSEAMNGSQIQGKEVKEQSSLSFCRNTQHLAAGRWVDALKHILQIGCFPAVSNTIVDDLTMYLVGSNIDERHEQDTPNRGRASRWYPQPRSGIQY